MEVVNLKYQETAIEFFQVGQEDVMVNATQMAKVFGKSLGHFLRNRNTKAFINACLNNPKTDYLNIQKKDDIILSKPRAGTWMHEILALKFAAWLDPNFEVWVYSTIRALLLGPYKELHNATMERKELERQLAEKKIALREKYPEAQEIYELEVEVKEKKSRRIKAVRDTYQLKIGM